MIGSRRMLWSLLNSGGVALWMADCRGESAAMVAKGAIWSWRGLRRWDEMGGTLRGSLAVGKMSLWLCWGFGRPCVGSVEASEVGFKFEGGGIVGQAGARGEGEFSCKGSGVWLSTILRDALLRESSGRREAAGVGCLLEAGRVGPGTNRLPRTSDDKADASRTTPLPNGACRSLKLGRDSASCAACCCCSASRERVLVGGMWAR